jgi:hypothetical protein
MKKTKLVLISVAVTWLVCYTLIFLANMIVFPSPSAAVRNFAIQPIIDPSKMIVKVSASSDAAQNPIVVQSEKADLFTRPIVPASLGSIAFCLWMYCGYELKRVGYRGNPPLLK